MDHIAFDHQVVIKKIRAVSIVRKNATHFRSGEKYIFRFLFLEKIFYLFLVPQIDSSRRRTSKRFVNPSAFSLRTNG